MSEQTVHAWKYQLATVINDATHDLTQVETARRLGITQPKVSDLRHFRLTAYSVERLMGWVLQLGFDVEIRVGPPGGRRHAG